MKAVLGVCRTAAVLAGGSMAAGEISSMSYGVFQIRWLLVTSHMGHQVPSWVLTCISHHHQNAPALSVISSYVLYR